ncbi:MAG: hypothetical protein ACR2N5_05450, partial [Solirubrobacterales bacterium]
TAHTNSQGKVTPFEDNDFDTNDSESVNTVFSEALNVIQIHITYRGATGTAVSGELVMSGKTAGVGQCVIGGNLLVG